MKKKIPDFFSNTPPSTHLEKAEKQKRIKLMEGANRGRQANVVRERDSGMYIVPRTGQKPLKVAGTDGNPRVASDKAPLFWGKERKHKVIQEGMAAPKEEAQKKSRVFSSQDLHDFIPHSDKQKALVEGIDIANVEPHGEGWTSSWAVSGFGKNKNNTGVVFKGRMPDSQIDEVSYGKHMEMLTTAQREGLYHNIANHMGLGQYVPTTAVIHDKTPGADPLVTHHGPSGNHYSVMEKIPNAEFYNGGEKHKAILNDLHQSGELHKLGIMNALLGNTDRHSANWMMSPKGLHLIDHGLTFDYHNEERDFVYPAYLSSGLDASGKNSWSPDPLHDNAKKWLLGLDHGEMKKFLRSHKVHKDFKEPLLGALLFAQNQVKENPSITIGQLLGDIEKHTREYRK